MKVIDKLVICPTFNGYEVQIENCLKKNHENSMVFSYSESDFLNRYTKIILFIYRQIFRPLKFIEYYYLGLNKISLFGIENILDRLDKELMLLGVERVNSILIIKGFGINDKDLSAFKKKYQPINVSIFQWDAIFKYPTIKSLYNQCDKVYCFQLSDAKKYNYNYLPNYFVKDENTNNSIDFFNKEIDVSYVGKFTLARYFALRNITKKNRKLVFDINIFTNNRLLHSIFDRKLLCELPLSREKVNLLYRRSKAIIDMPIDNQTGLSQRLFEAINNECTYISLRKGDMPSSLCKYDEFVFYCRDEIPIRAFNKKKFSAIKSEIEKYELNDWLKEVF